VDVSVSGHRQSWCHRGLHIFGQRNLKDAHQFFRRAYKRHGLPSQVTIDGSQTNLEAARRCHGEVRLRERSSAGPVIIRQSQYMNNRIEQDHRRIKRRTRPMLGFKSMVSATIILGGIELIHMVRKGQIAGTEGAIRPWPVNSTVWLRKPPCQRAHSVAPSGLRQNRWPHYA
jgi:transposase-like protein